MRNSPQSKSCSRQIRKLLLPLSILSAIALSACSTPQAVGQATVAPAQPPAHPVLPRPAPLELQEFQVQVQPSVAGKPPLVTMTFQDYSSILQDLGAAASRICQDSWMLDYYEGKNDGVKPADFCPLPPLEMPAPPKK